MCICALEDRVKVKTNDFHFIVWFCKLGQGETKEIATSWDLLGYKILSNYLCFSK